jgi:AcrR family transcriptional regulator
MATDVKGRDSRSRGEGDGGAEQARAEQARTRLARAAVADAARTLFLERGYATTTIDMISAESGVPAPTVYRLFASKIGLLKALVDQAITGDDNPVPMEHRERVQGLLASADPRAQLAGLAAIVRQVNGRAAAAHPLLVRAADSDAEAAGLLADYDQQRQHGQGLFASALARTGALRPGLAEHDAADIIHALASPEMYRLLVTERGWTPDRFEQWLTETLASQLLAQRRQPEGKQS